MARPAGSGHAGQAAIWVITGQSSRRVFLTLVAPSVYPQRRQPFSSRVDTSCSGAVARIQRPESAILFARH